LSAYSRWSRKASGRKPASRCVERNPWTRATSPVRPVGGLPTAQDRTFERIGLVDLANQPRPSGSCVSGKFSRHLLVRRCQSDDGWGAGFLRAARPARGSSTTHVAHQVLVAKRPLTSGAAAAALVASFHRTFGLTRYVDLGSSYLADLFPARRPAGNLGARSFVGCLPASGCSGGAA
jgi:hypothetical protein